MRMSLRNSFGNSIVRPSKNTRWTVNLVHRRNAKLDAVRCEVLDNAGSDSLTEKDRDVDADATGKRPQENKGAAPSTAGDQGTDTAAFLSFVVPRTCVGGEYRIEIADFNKKLPFRGSVLHEVHVVNRSNEVTIIGHDGDALRTGSTIALQVPEAKPAGSDRADGVGEFQEFTVINLRRNAEGNLVAILDRRITFSDAGFPALGNLLRGKDISGVGAKGTCKAVLLDAQENILAVQEPLLAKDMTLRYPHAIENGAVNVTLALGTTLLYEERAENGFVGLCRFLGINLYRALVACAASCKAAAAKAAAKAPPKHEGGDDENSDKTSGDNSGENSGDDAEDVRIDLPAASIANGLKLEGPDGDEKKDDDDEAADATIGDGLKEQASTLAKLKRQETSSFLRSDRLELHGLLLRIELQVCAHASDYVSEKTRDYLNAYVPNSKDWYRKKLWTPVLVSTVAIEVGEDNDPLLRELPMSSHEKTAMYKSLEMLKKERFSPEEREKAKAKGQQIVDDGRLFVSTETAPNVLAIAGTGAKNFTMGISRLPSDSAGEGGEGVELSITFDLVDTADYLKYPMDHFRVAAHVVGEGRDSISVPTYYGTYRRGRFISLDPACEEGWKYPPEEDERAQALRAAWAVSAENFEKTKAYTAAKLSACGSTAKRSVLACRDAVAERVRKAQEAAQRRKEEREKETDEADRADAGEEEKD